ncbi:oligosaccharide flippase family protein [Halorhabdus amylolytica]|uniref:oligosaccharide flippase family protein n=1 Tax=Halorhabdus amylolytica TaxID=2559573 RepID=UPI0010A9C5FD|nr:oligosaccharide flippase family protein [Halorhabdus amylolytica]
MSDKEVGDTEFGLQVSLGFVGEVVTAVVGLAGSVILARTLGPSGYGLFYVALAVSNFFENPVNGWAAACKKRLTETSFDEHEAIGSVLLTVTVTAVFGAPLAFVVLTLVSENALLPLAVPVLLVPMSAYRALKTILTGRENFSLSTWSKVVRTILKVFLQVGFVLLGLEVWGMIAGTAFAALLTIPLIYRWINVRPRRPSVDSLRSIMTFAKWSIPNGLVSTTLSKMDIVLLGWLATASAAGDYRVSLSLSMPAIFLSGVITTGLMGRISNLESRGEGWNTDLRNALSFSSILAIPLFIGSVVLGETIVVTVYSNQYAGAGLFLAGLTLYQLLVTQTTPRTSVIHGLNRPGTNFRISLTGLVLNVSLGISLLYLYGPIGIVVATVLTQTFVYLSRTYVVTKLTDRPILITRPFLEQAGAGMVMGAIVWGSRQLFTLNQWYKVVGLVGVGGLVYVVVLLTVSPTLRVTASGIFSDFLERYK